MNPLIEKLRKAGQDVSWYDRNAHSSEVKHEAPARCGYFSIYVLEGDWAWTRTNDGEPYLKYKKLKSPVVTRKYYCDSCKARFKIYDLAVKHYEVKS